MQMFWAELLPFGVRMLYQLIYVNSLIKIRCVLNWHIGMRKLRFWQSLGAGRNGVLRAGPPPPTRKHGLVSSSGTSLIQASAAKSIPFLGLARACCRGGLILAKCCNVRGGFCVRRWQGHPAPIPARSARRHRPVQRLTTIVYAGDLHVFFIKKKKRKIFMFLRSPSPNKKTLWLNRKKCL